MAMRIRTVKRGIWFLLLGMAFGGWQMGFVFAAFAQSTNPAPAQKITKPTPKSQKPKNLRSQKRSGKTIDSKKNSARKKLRNTTVLTPYPTQSPPEKLRLLATKAVNENSIPIDFVRRIVAQARRSGVPEDRLKEIVVEDENGVLVNAIAFLRQYDLRRQDVMRRRLERRNRRRFTVHEMLDELNYTQPKDLAHLRNTLPLDARE